MLFVSICTGAESRSWTLVDGAEFEAEYVITIGGKANLKLPTGKIVKLPMDRFSSEDLLYIELENPPKLKTEFSKKSDQKVFHLLPSQEDYTQRPPERWVQYGVRIKQVGGQPYKHELYAVFYAIGQEQTGDRLILLDRQETDPFFLTRENGLEYEFRSEREVTLRNWTVLNEKRKRGSKYYGFLILVRDTRGKIIASDTSHNWLLENHEKLNERGIGNFMDKTCTRKFPTRPGIEYY